MHGQAGCWVTEREILGGGRGCFRLTRMLAFYLWGT